MVKVYGSSFSTCTRRALTVAEELGIPAELVTVDMSKGEHKQPDYLAKQPFGQIPILEDGNLRVFESRAIARHLIRSSKNGDDLAGSTLEEKAMVDQWLEVEQANYNPPISAIVGQKFFAPMMGGQTDQAKVEAETAKLERVLDIYEAHFAETGNQYLAGNKYSLADLSHLPYTAYLFACNSGDLITSRPHVKAWWERISSRPAWQKVSGGK
eukprot:jgi/Chlat1/7962/Chrsp69S07395